MDIVKQDEVSVFEWRRLTEECPTWAIGVPVVFAFLVIAIIFLYRQEVSTGFKIFVTFIALAVMHTAIGTGMSADTPVMMIVRLAWTFGGAALLFLAFFGAAILWRQDIMQKLIASAVTGLLFLFGFAVVFAMNFLANTTTLPVFVYVLCAILVLAWLAEVCTQPAALVTAGAVFLISCVYVAMGWLLVSLFSWLVILVPALGVAMFYVGMMYIRDAKSVHFLWAIFLGLLRTTVYLILAVVFMLPGCQYSDRQVNESKVIILFDVSGSMFVKDDLVEPGVDAKTLLTRQEKIVRAMTDVKAAKGEQVPSFLDRVVEKSPLLAGRFGPVLDEIDLINLNQRKQQKSLPAEEWRKWLTPNKSDIPAPKLEDLKDEAAKKEKLDQFAKRLDLVETLRSGTNIGLACLQMHKLENSSFIQAIIVISDGQNNVGSDDARAQFLDRVNNAKKTIPVITIGVGEFRLPIEIRIDDINAPEATRPDDAFKVKVPVVSTGIPGEDFKVTLEVRRIEDKNGIAVNEKPFTLPTKEDIEKYKEKLGKLTTKEKEKLKPLGVGTFKGAGDQQQGIVEFEVDVQRLKEIESAKDDSGLLEGKWEIKAKTPRHPKEPFAEDFHESEPVTVQIQKRKLRVLLMCGGATKEYQFLRTVLYREMNEKRMEFCIFNQSTVGEDHIDQDVPPERMLQAFPERLGPNELGKQFESLSDYDAIIAFDPDWTKLSLKQRKVLNDWVTTHNGGIIFVAGPVFSHQIARPGGEKLDDILSIYPVVLDDARLHGLGLQGGHDASRPYPLRFNPAIKQFDFIKLDEAGASPIAGWKAFFWGDENAAPAPGDTPKRGFFTYYPVQRIKVNSLTIAAFDGPKDSRIGAKTDAFTDQMPFIVSMPVGNGKSLYVGSGEFWRLRAHRDGYHERIWIKMAREVAAGAREQKKYGRLLMPRIASVGRIQVDAMLKGKDFKPLDAGIVPTVLVRKVDKKNRPDGGADPRGKDKDMQKDLKDKDGKGKDGKVETKEINLKFDLKAKPVADGEEWGGTFYGSIVLTEDGEYEFKVPIPGVENEYLKQNLLVRRPNPELDNKRTNFAYLHQLASPSDTLLKNLPLETKKRIEALLQAPDGVVVPAGDKVSKRLFFNLSSADAITDCLIQVPPKSDTIKGRFEDLWDIKIERSWWSPWVFWPLVVIPPLIGVLVAILFLIFGSWQGALASYVFAQFIGLLPVLMYFSTEESVEIFWAVILAPLAVGLVGAIILLVMRQWISAPVFFVGCGMLSLLGLWFCFMPGLSVLAACGLLGLAGFVYAIVLAIQKDFFVAAILAVISLAVAYFGLHANLAWRSQMEGLALSVWTDPLPIGYSVVLIVAVSLVGIEWLTRKLLRLA